MDTTEYKPFSEELTLPFALEAACKLSLSRNKLVRGARQISKAILRDQAKVLVLSKSCPKDILQILEGLAKNKNVPIIKASDDLFKNVTGFNKLKMDDTYKHPKACAVSIKDFVEEDREEVRFLVQELQSGNVIEI